MKKLNTFNKNSIKRGKTSHLLKALASLLILLPTSLAAQNQSNEITLDDNSGKITLTDGSILTGKGGAQTHVTIADGATVTLSNVDITSMKETVIIDGQAFHAKEMP